MMEPQIPPELAGIAAFLNTLDRESGVDAIGTPAGFKQWLVDQQLVAKSARVTAADVARAVVVREALRDGLRGEDVPALNHVLRSWPLQVQLARDGRPEVMPLAAGGVDAALGRLVAAIAAAGAAGTWGRLKVCASDTCRWAFYDHSRNRSGRWCSMQVCGNRSKIRTYRSGRAAG